jgi:NAD(P)H-flavin reductase
VWLYRRSVGSPGAGRRRCTTCAGRSGCSPTCSSSSRRCSPSSWGRTRRRAPYIDAGVLERHLPAPYAEHAYFICGPDLMMDAIEEALGALEVPMSKYHSERYSFV